MARKSLSFPALPEVAIAHGATLPDLGAVRAYAWSTTENDIVAWNGVWWTVAGRGVSPTRPLYALSNFSAANFYGTQSGGGEAGVATGFGTILLYWLGRTSAEIITQKMPAAATSGWALHRHGANGDLYWYVADGGGTLRPSIVPQPTANLGQIVPIVCLHRGASIQAYAGMVSAGSRSPSTAVTGFTPAAIAEVIGGAVASPHVHSGLLAQVTFRGVPTDAQLDAYLLEARALGDLPATLAGATITHRRSLREALAGQAVTDGQLAPATLADTVTGAAADAMTRTGSPVVRVIDTSIDERKSYGVMGWDSSSYVRSDVAVISGATVDVSADLTLYDIATSGRHFLNNSNGSATGGFSLIMSDANQIGVYNYATSAMVASAALSAADVGVRTTWRIVYNGSVWRFYKDGVQQGLDTAGVYGASSAQLYVGNHFVGNHPAGNAVIHRVVIAGAHDYDFTQDIAPAPAASVPALITDSAGSHPLSRVGTGLTVSVVDGVHGATNFSPASHFATTSGQGILGSATTGLTVLVALRLPAMPTQAGRIIVSAYSANGARGYSLFVGPTRIDAWLPSIGAALKVRDLVTGDLNRTVIAALTWVSGGVYTSYFDGTQTATVNGTFLPTTDTGMQVGLASRTGESLGTFGSVLDVAGCDQPLSAAQIAAGVEAYRDTGSFALPSGVTNPHIYSISRNIRATLDERNVPPQILDRVGTDHLSRVGTGLVVSRRTERVWSYESTPQQIGARGWSASNYFAGAMTAFGHTAQPFWFLYPIIVHSKTGASLNILGKANSGGTQGFNPYCGTAFSSLGMYFGTGTSYAAAPNLTVLDTDVGRPLLLAYQWTGSALQAFAKRARLGGDVTAATYGPYAGNLALGRHPESPMNPLGDQATLLGFMGGLGNISLAEYQAAHDAYFAENDLIAIPGKTLRLYSTKKTVLANGGALAALVDQMGNGQTLPIIGAPTVSNIYAHAA